MSFADTLKKRAKESGQKTVQGVKPTVEKHENKASFAAALKKHSTEKAVAAKKAVEIDTYEFQTGPVKHWSFSTLKNYETCPYMVQKAKIDKEPQESGPAAERGSQLHLECEDFIQGKNDKVYGDRRSRFDFFQAELERLRDQFEAGKVIIEQDWGIRKDWSPCTWKDDDLWGRAKLDVFEIESPTSCVITDWKSGRKFGNEAKHADQGISYALHAMHRYPEMETFLIRFAYLDQADYFKKYMTRAQLNLLLPRYHNRAKGMTTATTFKAKSNCDSCRFCPYGSNKNKEGRQYGTGTCEFDYYRG